MESGRVPECRSISIDPISGEIAIQFYFRIQKLISARKLVSGDKVAHGEPVDFRRD